MSMALALAALAGCTVSGGGSSATPRRSPIPVEIESPTPVAPSEEPEPDVARDDVDAYASGVCRGVAGWLEATASATGRTIRRIRGAGVAETRAAVVAYVERQVEATDAFIAYLETTEPPRSRGALRGHEFLLVAFDEARDAFARRRADARALTPAALRRFDAYADELGESVIVIRDRVGRVFARAPYDRRTVAAFGRAQACTALDEALGIEETAKV